MAGLVSGAHGGVGNRTMDRMLGVRNLSVPRNNRIAVFGPSQAANHFSQSVDSTGAAVLPERIGAGPCQLGELPVGRRRAARGA